MSRLDPSTVFVTLNEKLINDPIITMKNRAMKQ